MASAGFQALSLPLGCYSSDEGSLLDEVVRPLLESSDSYDRSVGYLLPSHFTDVDIELLDLVERGGRARFLIGDPLGAEMLQAAQTAALSSREDLAGMGNKLREVLREADPEGGQPGLALVVFQYLIATSLVDVRLNLRERGRHHEKTRIARDFHGNVVLTVGSDNDSTNALTGLNGESGTLIASWMYPGTDYWSSHGEPHIKRFERLWNNQDRDSVTLTLDEQIREEIESDWRERKLSVGRIKELLQRYRRIERGEQKELRGYQEKAIKEWVSRNTRGVLAFCTGAGKTFTAIEATKTVAEGYRGVDRPLFVIICVPFKILASQWLDELKEHFDDVHACWSDHPGWEQRLESAIWGARRHDQFQVLVAVVVNNTLGSNDFQRLLRQLPLSDTMIIGDEVHRHGTEKFSELIPKATYRLGLSATPWAQHESAREAVITELYGEVIAEFGLAEALRQNVLCPYFYELIEAPLTVMEAQRYEEIAERIALFEVQKGRQGVRVPADSLETLIRRRSSILGTCWSKREWVRAVAGAKKQSHALFYCSEGPAQEEGEELDESALEVFAKLLAGCDWDLGKITAEESTRQRKKALQDFTSGSLDGLVAMKVLDEGFDLPACRVAFLLSSSRNERQFIQRRGRVLRRFTGKQSATIYDFFVLPTEEYAGTEWAAELVFNEAVRAWEFARFSLVAEKNEAMIQRLCRTFEVDFEEIKTLVEQRRYLSQED